MSRRRMLMNRPNDTILIPEEYKKLNYVESHGNSYFVTDILSSNNTGVDVSFQFYDGTSGMYSENNYVLGTANREVRLSPIFYDPQHNDGMFSYTPTQTFETISYGAIDSSIHRVSFNKDSSRNILWDNNLVGTVGVIGTAISSEYTVVFGRSTWGRIDVFSFPLRIYHCDFYENGVLVSSLVPAERKLDNVVGMYDVVRHLFYDSDTDIDFIGG